MIPKILHFIWFGDESYPIDIINSWSLLHNDYEIKFWNEKNLIQLDNIDHWNTSDKRYNQKSDIARYEILKKYGGFYIDMDIYCINRIPDFIQSKELYVCFEKKGVICNSFIGCEKESKLMENIISVIKTNYSYTEKIWKCTGPLMFTKQISLIDLNENIIIDNPSKINLFSKWSMIMLDNESDFNEFLNLNKQSILNRKINIDLRYKWDKNIETIIGVQLWLGGKKYKYKKIKNLKSTQVKRNLELYISLLNTSKKKCNDFDTKTFRFI